MFCAPPAKSASTGLTKSSSARPNEQLSTVRNNNNNNNNNKPLNMICQISNHCDDTISTLTVSTDSCNESSELAWEHSMIRRDFLLRPSALDSPFRFVERATAANDIVVFTTSYGCESIRTKAFFEKKEYQGIDVKFYDLDTLPNGKYLLDILPNSPTIYIKKHQIGRLQDLELALEAGILKETLRNAQ